MKKNKRKHIFLRRVGACIAILLGSVILLGTVTFVARSFYQISVGHFTPFLDREDSQGVSHEMMPEYTRYTGLVNYVRFANQQGSLYRVSLIQSDISEVVLYFTGDDVRKADVYEKNVVTGAVSQKRFEDMAAGQVVEVDFHYAPGTPKPSNFAEHALSESIAIYILRP